MITRRSMCSLGLASGLLALGATPARAADFPASIALPDGWLPEGIVTGRGPVVYAGSRANGAIYAADLQTGSGRILVPGVVGRVAVGLDFDTRTNFIFVAGGATGLARVHDAATGATLATYTLTSSGPSFINDVIVTRDAAWFTESMQPVIYRLALGPGGTLRGQEGVTALPLGGDYTHVSGLNLNGIEATANGKALVAVHSTLGVLYRISPHTGRALRVDLGGASVTMGDGLLLQGRTLYVVRNRANEVLSVRLGPEETSGMVTQVITSPAFDVPTTMAAYGDRLYVVNARFTTPALPTTAYNIVQVPQG